MNIVRTNQKQRERVPDIYREIEMIKYSLIDMVMNVNV